MFLPSSTTNLGQSELDTPDFTLVAQTVFTDNLQFRVSVPSAQNVRQGDISDMKHSQASAQWPGYETYRRADSNARDHTEMLVLIFCLESCEG